MTKSYLAPLLACLMALSLMGCGSNDASLPGQPDEESSAEASFRQYSYTQLETSPVTKGNANAVTTGTEEKLNCKILKDGKLLLTHKNVVFDDATDIKVSTTLQGGQITVVEKGDYGLSGKYGYYTLTSTVGTLKDGDYTIVVMRNENVRAMFQMTYDSSKAKE